MKTLSKLNIILELSKVRITFFVTVTTIFGYLCAAGKVDGKAWLTALGVFALACGSSVFNHVQEASTDAAMARTKNRPIPSGKISKSSAVLVGIFYLISGTITLWAFSGTPALLLGLLTLVWYNLIYTPMKKRNFLAIIPGSVIGALPPVIGWVAAGGNPVDRQIIVIASFFFIWQIPHFWLLLMLYRQDYESAGFPTIFRIFSEQQLSRITWVWTVATGLVGLLFPVFSIVQPSAIGIIMLLSFLWLFFRSSVLLKKDLSRVTFIHVFKEINIYVLLICLFHSSV
ncbi:MAG: protoheme IX farnesyltransferase [Ignavibacteriales bacterium]|nr:protoheme IX farnesyltransferase [Ignavibacteriales bacterium]